MRAFILQLKTPHNPETTLLKRINVESYKQLAEFIHQFNLFHLLNAMPLQTQFQQDVYNVQITNHLQIQGTHPRDWHKEVEKLRNT
jgi:hypothetical protein